MTGYNHKHYTIWVMNGVQVLMANMCEIFRGTKEEVAEYMKKNNIKITF